MGGRNCLLWIKYAIFIGIIITTSLAEQRRDDDLGDTRSSKGLFPNVFNLAATSEITANATCGETKAGAETYCKLVEHVLLREDEKRGRAKSSREPQCGVCDSTSSSPDKRHPISNAIDGTNRWWQSPTLQNGKQYEWVTIALDLGEIYQVAYVIVKAAISPRPGNWILERSIDGIIYKPWQYYALSDSECWETYGIRPTIGKPRYRTDDEVICTSYYSKLDPLENGEIHTSLVNGRPGVDGPSIKLRDFTKARYVRLRLQKIRTLHADLMTLQSDEPERIDKSVTRRYFYSIKDISIGGQCVCSGHAESCSSDASTGKQRCVCEHNTCGENCERCCPLFNQKPWRPGTSLDGAACERCECNGHSDSCHYDPNVADERQSINTNGVYEGGGVCDRCKHHTTGINCEQCEDGYFRPANVPRNHSRPCKKCQCDGPGMTGICVKDDSHLKEGLEPGDCLCKPGYTGKICNECAVGYRNVSSLCEPCPCHSAGTVGGATCEGECVCKVNVEGHRCEKCKPGYYHLSADNPDGCSQCFCFGSTDECVEGDWGVELIEKMEDWRVTDIRGRRVVRPTLYNGNLVIAHDEVTHFTNYYWLAPPDYLGKKLYSYGADLKFTVSYVRARGDTSGTPTGGADVILEGNGDQFGYNFGTHPDSKPFTITMHLREQGWFRMSPSGDNIGSVSREAFTLALNNVTRILIRAKFHTDQVEGKLHDIGMEIAEKESKTLKKLESVEKCVCPHGYAGLSCEICAPGYRQVGSSDGIRIICQPCDCYNHAEFCDADTGRCRNCLHNTTGLKCDRCVRGFYGDAKHGTPHDCKPCACPLEIPENNFSPSCTAIESGTRSDYVCDRCPEGFEGDKCESCSDGYFGNPQIPGGYCQPCDCSGNADTSEPGWCDRLTGQCLKCLGNTAGWNCGECLPGHHGNPEQRDCRPCSCNHHGSVSSQCDHTTGQCICKPRFIGRTCNRCADGFGNVGSGCEPCRCNRIGSQTETCDPVSGICLCKPGVFGVTCDSCLEGHYGFSRQGCLECNCSPYGAVSPQCDENNGQCTCKPRVTGRACDRCEDGFWNINSGDGCEECQCNRTGSVASLCDKSTGQCSCKTGVGGKYCDQCLPGYYKFTAHGCRKCDPCDRPGHICDPNNGRCVCPPYTTGKRCQKCVQNAWGYNPLTGCMPCDCNIQGSPSQTCDSNTGNCVCLEGFEGRLCDQCRHGYYNFPSCFRCDCNVAGTDTSRCQLKDGVCQCNERGQCNCKENVMGQKCSHCIEGAFSLTAENPKGCHQCFCFGRTQKCNQATMAWSRVTFPSRDVFMEVGTSEIPTVLGFQTVPNDLTGRTLGIPYVLDKPLYWSLPKEALGDKVLSYNGYLSFQVEGRSQSHFPDALLHRYPLVVLQGNHRLVLVHYGSSERTRGPYRVQLYEAEWKLRDNPQIPVRKEDLMVALQNVQAVLIRGTDGPDVKYARLYNVSLDTAVASYHPSVIAEGIEMCRCTRQYVGASCQDPAPGYYRKRKPNYLDSKNVLDLVGWAEPCSCNNHTNICDRETGVCIDCSGNTMGPSCDQCVKGFYGDPRRGPCRPCACPHLTNSFSDTCVPDAVDYLCIDCQTGYTGRHCERCASGYYGDPLREGGHCVPCNCNPYGSQSRDCDQVTGQCVCNEGISGRDCTVCSHGFILTEYGCKSCDDECTGVLLRELYQLQLQIQTINVSDIPRLPWGFLSNMSRSEQQLRPLVTEYQRILSLGKEMVNNFTFQFDLEAVADMLFVRAKEYVVKAGMVSTDAKDTLDEAEKLLQELNKVRRFIEDLAAELNHYGLDPTGPIVSVTRLLREAERILAEIRSRNFGPDKDNADRELRKAHNLLNRVKDLTLDRGLLDDLKQKMNVLNDLLADIVKRIDENVRRPVDRASGIIRASQPINNEVKGIVDGISGILDGCDASLKEASDLLGKARRDVTDAAVKYQFLPKHLRHLENATDRLDEHRSILARLNPLYKDQYVIPAQRHADELQRQSDNLARLFSPTRELSEFALQAVRAYQNITDAIKAADVAADEAYKAANNAFRQAYPDTDDSLVDQAAKAKERSIQLLAEAERLNNIEVPELEASMHARKNDLNNLARDVAYGRRNNDVINRNLDALPKGIGDSLGDPLAIKNRADAADEKADRINHNIETVLKPKLESILAGSVGGLENLTQMIEKARGDVREASRHAENAAESAQRVNRLNSAVRLNLKELKDKILLARQKASSIRVALTVDSAGNCARSYKPITEPSTTTNIVLNYAIKSDRTNSMLFYLGSSNEELEDFMAIEMVNRKIRFLWNAGGGTHFIEHSKTIETNNEQLLRNEQWFKIEANRIGNLATLSVKHTPDGQKPDPSEVSGASPVGYTKMDLDSTSNFFIGGFPQGFVKPSEMRTSSFAGCLYEVILDGKPVGLWNFISNEGCDGCKEGATEEIDISAYEFQGGSSYAIMPRIPYYRKSDLYIALSFKTLNEDGLLFFAGNPSAGDFISVELKEGKIVYQLKFAGGRSHISLTTSNKYNTGNWVRVQAARDRYEAQMHVENEKLEGSGAKKASSTLDLLRMPIYFGGVPPNFTLESWPGIMFTSYFGCLKDLQIDSTPIALSRGSFYGMTVGCSSRPVKAAVFKGSGFLELNSQPIIADSSFTFSFFTKQKDALLLVSTFSGQEADQDKLQNYYSVSLKDGKIDARFNSGTGETPVVSDQELASGMFHTVNVIRKNRRLVLRIDDIEVADIKLSRGAKDISAPQNGGLFIGGVKEGVSVDNMVASPQKLIGIISDVVFNNVLMNFENSVGHRGVDFGQPDVNSISLNPFQQMALSYPSESCYTSYALLEKDTISFKGTPKDFVPYSFGKKELTRNFNISFEFRTFHTNGILFSVKNDLKKQQLAVYIKENYVRVDFRRKKAEHRNILSNSELTHGEWHKIGLRKSGKILSLYINQKEIASTHIPKKLAFKSPLYIGGMPADAKADVSMVTSSYHGCFRNLMINGNVRKLPVTDRLCFTDVERGLYFTGMGYATYDSPFNTTQKQLVISAVFRTTQMNGVFLSLHDEFNAVWLKLQLLDGEMIATLNQETSSSMFKLSSSFDSKYDMCDNKWHTILVAHKGSTLTLMLDRLRSVHREVEISSFEFKPTTLYIGGTPKKYHHSFATEKDFVGCLQNLSVNGQIINFERVKTSSQTIHHSCPHL